MEPGPGDDQGDEVPPSCLHGMSVAGRRVLERTICNDVVCILLALACVPRQVVVDRSGAVYHISRFGLEQEQDGRECGVLPGVLTARVKKEGRDGGKRKVSRWVHHKFIAIVVSQQATSGNGC
jgi:hypothetical protein